MTSSQHFLTIIALTLVTGATSGCRKDEDAKPDTQQPGAPQAQTQAAAPAAEVVDVPPGPLGIATCDDFLAKSERCVSEKVPAKDKEPLAKVVEAVRHAYKLEFMKPETKARLPQHCADDLQKTKESLKQYKCDWESPVSAAGDADKGAAGDADKGAAAADAAVAEAHDAGASEGKATAKAPTAKTAKKAHK